MWNKHDLLHPATIIATGALFMSLGGVSYAAVKISSANIKTGAVTASKVRSNAITTAKLKDGAVTAQKLAAGSVIAGKIGPSAVGGSELTDGAVTESKLGTAAVTNGKLGAAAVSSSKLADSAVTTGKLADNAVTTPKLADAAVTTGKLADSAVTASKLGAASVTPDKLAQSYVQGTGSTFTFRAVVPNGQTVTLFSFGALGPLTATCNAGNVTTTFTNQAGLPVTVWDSGVDNATPDVPFVERTEPPNGGAISHAGTGSITSVDWVLASTASNVTRVAHASVVSGATLTDCTVAATATYAG